MIYDEEEFFHWFNSEATPADLKLYERIGDFEDLFTDMLFKNGTSTYDMLKCQVANSDGSWSVSAISLPEELEEFDYSWFRYKVQDLSDCDGFFNGQDSLLCVKPDADDPTVLHEMIHLHEFIINELALYFHDMVYWGLYANLKEKIPQLDEIITNHAHLLTGSSLYSTGGLHDILFLLKSFDLDIRMGYSLGTVFAYGRKDDFKRYKYVN